VLGGGAHWCVAGLSAGSKDGMDCVDLVVVAGRRDKHRRVGFSAQPVPTDDRRPQERVRRRPRTAGAQASEPASQPASTLLFDVALSVKSKPLDNHHHPQP